MRFQKLDVDDLWFFDKIEGWLGLHPIPWRRRVFQHIYILYHYVYSNANCCNLHLRLDGLCDIRLWQLVYRPPSSHIYSWSIQSLDYTFGYIFVPDPMTWPKCYLRRGCARTNTCCSPKLWLCRSRRRLKCSVTLSGNCPVWFWVEILLVRSHTPLMVKTSIQRLRGGEYNIPPGMVPTENWDRDICMLKRTFLSKPNSNTTNWTVRFKKL